MLRTDPNLEGISHVIIDEVHERELKTDVVLALLKLMKRTTLKVIIFWSLGLEKKYFEIPRAPSEIPANQPTQQIKPFWADFSALGSGNTEGARGISKWFFLDHFSPSLLDQTFWE